MGIRFILMVNKKGQTRLAQCYEYPTIEERRALEGEIVRKCLARTELQNELTILEFIHLVVENMDRLFGNVCELDIMFHLEKVHFMLEEMVMNGCIVETSMSSILDSDTADGQRLVTIFTSTLQRCQIYLSLPTVPTHN